MPSDVLHVSNSNELSQPLRQAYKASRILSVVLDTGETFLLCPGDDFDALHALFNNEEWVTALERAVADFDSGRGSVFKASERPI